MLLEFNVDSADVPALTNIALPYFSWGLSITRVIPGIRGRSWIGPRWVSWIHSMSQSCSLQMLARRSSFVDDSPSMLADNDSNAGLGKGLLSICILACHNLTCRQRQKCLRNDSWALETL